MPNVTTFNPEGRYIVLPLVEICSHRIENFPVYVSHFEKSWGIDALIGLDFFRQFRVTIDYQQGALTTESYAVA
ncbi:MAG: hypothetical protein HYV02_08215 [Deltaproteobacteria bacterium]|nr:hypothetical protein [Deltaproteobacteria bacterium]